MDYAGFGRLQDGRFDLNLNDVRKLLERLTSGEENVDGVIRQLRAGPLRMERTADGFPDHHRLLRTGMAEAIFGESKSIEQITSLARSLSENGAPVLITRLDAAKRSALLALFSGSRVSDQAKTILIHPPEILEVQAVDAPSYGEPFAAIVTAGTSDIAVAEEAVEVCIACSIPFLRIRDAGVSGLHRILSYAEALQNASAIVVCAGMEGALPGVVAGMTGRPILAVPTSVGYGANLGGFSALLTMVNSCAAGVSVVNIDNGFSAGYAAASVIREIHRFQRKN